MVTLNKNQVLLFVIVFALAAIATLIFYNGEGFFILAFFSIYSYIISKSNKLWDKVSKDKFKDITLT